MKEIMTKLKVVFHLDESGRGRANLVLHNIENLIDDLGQDNVEIELVSNSEGVTALLKVPNVHGAMVERLVSKGVRFTACANSLRQLGLGKDALLEHVEIVPAGVGELAKRQAEGWAYIRP